MLEKKQIKWYLDPTAKIYVISNTNVKWNNQKACL